jgi:hypothetical protein
MVRSKGQDHGHHKADLHQGEGHPWKVAHHDPSSLEVDVLPGLLGSPTNLVHRDLFKGSRDKGLSKDKGVKGPIWDNLDLEIDLRTKTLQQEQQHL